MDSSPKTVGDVMTRTVVALSQGATFKDIARTMRQWAVSALPVLDDAGRVIGVVSEADLLRKEEYRDGDPPGPVFRRRPGEPHKAMAVSARELMTAPAVTVHADAPLARAARVMARRQVKRLPVVDREGVLKGIVSRADLLKVFLREDGELAREIRDEIASGRFPASMESVRVDVRDGVVTLTGHVPDLSLVPLAVRVVRSVEGVVDVHPVLSGPRGRPPLEPDFPDGGGGRAASAVTGDESGGRATAGQDPREGGERPRTPRAAGTS
ncbi:CBS domain-containing protein [Streptomyces sp. enrichment culture]|uniref:CBS domain-containing protein n=1 Tax=Streptomyces sp. enrichment culture TaxID=1795815 RepID=UPI003F553863